jgi:hypothetical protein
MEQSVSQQPPPGGPAFDRTGLKTALCSIPPTRCRQDSQLPLKYGTPLQNNRYETWRSRWMPLDTAKHLAVRQDLHEKVTVVVNKGFTQDY